jgi:hypothetical protein
LAAEEDAQEILIRVGDNGDARAALDSKRQQPLGGEHGALPQAPEGEDIGERPARRIEIETRVAARRIVERLPQGGEVAKPLRQRIIAPRRE